MRICSECFKKPEKHTTIVMIEKRKKKDYYNKKKFGGATHFGVGSTSGIFKTKH